MKVADNTLLGRWQYSFTGHLIHQVAPVSSLNMEQVWSPFVNPIAIDSTARYYLQLTLRPCGHVYRAEGPQPGYKLDNAGHLPE
jgi:hypothetical protein